MIFGDHDANTIGQFNEVAFGAYHSALMADGHFGYVMPIGGVAAYRNKVSPIGVGVDIACGNAAIRTDLNLSDLGDRVMLEEIADEIFTTIKFGAGGVNQCLDAPTAHLLFEDGRWQVVPKRHRTSLLEKARAQLGTTGGGNHYVDVFADEEERVWVGVHFGSRKLGYDLAHNFVALAQGLLWGETPNMNKEVLLPLSTSLGHDYWEAMELAGDYAYAGREWVARKVVDIMGGNEIELVHNHHNFAWKEEHFGEKLVVVRKGATPAFPGQQGFVGGSMGDDSVVLRGCTDGDIETQESALFSTVHGAGRVMGRADAKKGKWLGTENGKSIRDESTIVTREAMDDWVGELGVVLRGGDVDEAPQVYRRLPDVLKAQGDTIEILHTLKPLIVCMAPNGGRR